VKAAPGYPTFVTLPRFIILRTPPYCGLGAVVGEGAIVVVVGGSVVVGFGAVVVGAGAVDVGVALQLKAAMEASTPMKMAR
jgi:hypothetical protein